MVSVVPRGDLQQQPEELLAHRPGEGVEFVRTIEGDGPDPAGDLGAPNPGLSDRNGPSDPDAKRNR